jgi:hypothetical protein
MIRSERRTCTAKAVAEYLALIADVHHEFAPHPLGPVREADEELWECATEFGAAMEKFCAERAISMSTSNRRAAERAMRSEITVTLARHARRSAAGPWRFNQQRVPPMARRQESRHGYAASRGIGSATVTA